MPYITDAERSWLEKHWKEIPIKSPGQLNYVLTKIIHEYIEKNGTLNYTVINEVMGVLESVKLEFYRTIAAPYEDIKREQNGKVSKIDGHV